MFLIFLNEIHKERGKEWDRANNEIDNGWGLFRSIEKFTVPRPRKFQAGKRKMLTHFSEIAENQR